MKKNFVTGFIAGGIICAAVTGFAVEYAVTANPYPVKVNGIETTIQGYNINDETYFKLRDVSAAVGGFEVGFENNAIIVNTPNKPTPAPTATPTASADITIVKGEDGKDYTSDGLRIWYEDNIPYVQKGSIQEKIEEKNILGYSFSTYDLVKSESDGYKSILSDIPLCPSNSQLIPVEFYISTISPLIDTLK
jgi:hypothetical protein